MFYTDELLFKSNKNVFILIVNRNSNKKFNFTINAHIGQKF